MRLHILITLLHKEALRHLAHGRGLVFVAVLGLLSGAMAFLSRGYDFPLASKVDRCFIDYWHDGPWVEHLRANVPRELEGQITFRAIEHVAAAGETICYEAGTGAIQIRAGGDGVAGDGSKIWTWHPGKNGAAMARFEAWFWQETAVYFRQHWSTSPAPRNVEPIPNLEVEHSSLTGSADSQTTATTALLLFPLFLTCVYLLPAWMCEERERGLLLAVALTPATPLEMLAAQAMFCTALGIALSALVAGVTCPAVLGQGLFWLTLSAAALGAVGIGATIGSLVRRQRTASLAALSYMVAVAGFLAVGQGIGVPAMSWLALESHLPWLLHTAVSGTSDAQLGSHLLAALALALAWFFLATALFRRRGWQY